MSDWSMLIAIFFGAIFTNNILLTNYLGMCSFLSVSREIKTSLGLGTAVTFVMASTSLLNYLVYHFLLVPLGLTYLRFIVFIIVIAAFVQLVEMIIERVSEPLYAALGDFPAPDYGKLCNSRSEPFYGYTGVYSVGKFFLRFRFGPRLVACNYGNGRHSPEACQGKSA